MRRDVGARVAMALAACAITLLEAGAASAQSIPPVYPEADTDRPLVLFPGMTVFDGETDLATYFRTSLGGTTRFIQPVQNVAVEHAFGPVQLLAQIVFNPFGPFATVEATTMLGPGAVFVALDAQIRYPNNGIGYVYDEVAGYSYKWIAMPHKLAIYVGGNINVDEVEFTPAMQVESRDYSVTGQLGGSVEVQLTPRLAFDIGPSLTVPIAYSSGQSESTALGTASTLLLALRHWDIYASYALNDLLHRPINFAAAGFVHRWGG